MSLTCMHCFVSGRVQGVFYRKTAYQEAIARGIRGWVKNCSDGRVELMLEGESEAVEQMCDWLWVGPRDAQVLSVECKKAEPQLFTRFEIE